MAKFQEGDVVILKSGGPKMTVEGIGNYSSSYYAKSDETEVRCIWFKGDEKSEGVFKESTLQIFDPKATPLGANR